LSGDLAQKLNYQALEKIQEESKQYVINHNEAKQSER
jgi:hypothetical protein